MSVVPGDGERALMSARVDLVPALQVRVRPFVEPREEKVWIAPVRPEAVEEENRITDSFCVRVEIIDFDGVVAAHVPVSDLFGVADDRKPSVRLRAHDEFLKRSVRVGGREAGRDEKPPAVRGCKLAAADEDDAVARAVQSRLGGVDERVRVLGHHDEGEAVGLRRLDYL